jgi:DNA repair protein RadD
MILRDYQSAAVSATWEYISANPGNPCLVLPTGAGKSLVLAQLAHDAVTKWQGRVIVLAHVKELLEQNAGKLRAISPDLDIGVYSAGLNRRDKHCQVLVAGIQSVYKRACEFNPFDIAIVDEAHLLQPDGEGMYRSFISDLQKLAPHCRLIGLTATPYRMQTGWLCGPDNLLTDVAYEIGIKELIVGGYLSPLTSKEGMACDTSSLHVRGGEFVADEAEKLMLDVVRPACGEIVKRTESRRSVLVFCQSVEHAVTVSNMLRESMSRVELITGDTPAGARAEYLEAFKAGHIKYLVNVNVLTTGFDAPNVDCVCLLRPTMSPGLYYQMVGRGFRIADGKNNCLILDFAGNIKRHGPVDQIIVKPREIGAGDGGEAPTKTCPMCAEVCHAGFSECPDCGFQFEDRAAAKHETKPDEVSVTTLDIIRKEWPVVDVTYSKHIKKKDSAAPPTLRVDYKVNPIKWFSEWVCIEHEGYAGNKARLWWKARSNDPFPDSVDRAVEVADGGGLAVATQITVMEKANEFPKITAVKLGDKPEGIEIIEDSEDWDFPKPNTEEAMTDERVYLW